VKVACVVLRGLGGCEPTWLPGELLAEDAFDPRLKTHKLRGELEGSWACSAGYDLRILFEFVQHEGAEAISLQTVGTHDEVY
jgi:mRNA-degrading endonuclease YafQ of YafQ-DinJ toxin-antitoxin module